MMYAITFFCIGMSCEFTPEMQRYDDLYVFMTVEDCRAVAQTLRLSAGATRGCVGTDGVVVWVEPDAEPKFGGLK